MTDMYREKTTLIHWQYTEQMNGDYIVTHSAIN